jgi:hypothetical protein
MNFGDCPYTGCDGVFMLIVPERTPAYARVTCDACARPVWYRFSRVDPMAWTEEDFLTAHTIDTEKKTITEKRASMTEEQAPKPRTVDDLQRELLAICKGGSFAETWRRLVAPEQWPNLRSEWSKLDRVRVLRRQIAALDPNAALYYGWAGEGDDLDPKWRRL